MTPSSSPSSPSSFVFRDAMPRLKIAIFAAADMSIRFLLLDQIKALQEMGHEVVALCAPGKWVDEVRSFEVTVETSPTLLSIVIELAPETAQERLLCCPRAIRVGAAKPPGARKHPMY